MQKKKKLSCRISCILYPVSLFSDDGFEVDEEQTGA